MFHSKHCFTGLDFIIEYIDPDVNMQRIYECKLCKTWNPAATVLAHLTGYPHRTNFIVINPTLFILLIKILF